MIEFKTITLCADDFGLNPGVSQGILKLVRSKRLSAVSCMVNMPDFIHHAKELMDFKSQVQIGLHFNLTEGDLISTTSQRCFHLNELLIKAYLRLIKASFVAKELNAQLDRFIELTGCLPDFIDGHQHVHQFPGIRQVVLDVYKERFQGKKTFIRITSPAISLPQYQLKTKILEMIGGSVLHHQINQLGIPHNNCFAGIYDFAKESNYRSLFRRWLALAQNNTLIMCHPGVEDKNSTDSIAHARLKEMDYFLSDAFISDCKEHKIQLTTGPKS